MNDIISVYITSPSEELAQDIAEALIEKRLVACTNIFPVQSIYWWQGEVINEPEMVVIAHTIEAKFKDVEVLVEEMHTYAVPCISKTVATVNDKYAAWVRGEVAGKA